MVVPPGPQELSISTRKPADIRFPGLLAKFPALQQPAEGQGQGEHKWGLTIPSSCRGMYVNFRSHEIGQSHHGPRVVGASPEGCGTQAWGLGGSWGSKSQLQGAPAVICPHSTTEETKPQSREGI